LFVGKYRSIISLVSILHVAWSNSHELHPMDEICFQNLLKFQSDNELETRYLIFNLEDVGFQIHKFSTKQMYMLQSMGLGE
jgi:hypothetical protein